MTPNELIEEVERQVAEYDLSTNDAVENVADADGRPWLEVWNEYCAAKGSYDYSVTT